MNQISYRLRSSSAGPRPSGPVENERLAQVVMLDHHKESMPGREVRVSTHNVAAEAGMRVEVASGDTPWGLSSSPHFNTTTPQKPLSPSSLSNIFGETNRTLGRCEGLTEKLAKSM